MVQYWPILLTVLVALVSVQVLSAKSKSRPLVSGKKSRTMTSPRMPISKSQSKPPALKGWDIIQKTIL